MFIPNIYQPHPVTSVSVHISILLFIFNSIEKHNVSDERMALENVLLQLESEIQRLNPSIVDNTNQQQEPVEQQQQLPFIYLSGLPYPNIGDIAVYGTLRAIQGLPIYDEIILHRGGPIVIWSNHMVHEMKNVYN